MSKLARLMLAVKSLPYWIELCGRASYLERSGWFKSRQRRQPVDSQGEPIPWITYPAIHFLNGRVRPEMRVFEFGSGASTLWWARRVRSVTSCEHDLAWFERTRASVPSNVQLSHVAREGQQYSREILRYERAFEIVVIDGRDRVECAKNCLGALTADGVVIWDNSDREEYQPGFDFLLQHGFRRLDFTGLGPLVAFDWCTSIFYRDQNCLGL